MRHVFLIHRVRRQETRSRIAREKVLDRTLIDAIAAVPYRDSPIIAACRLEAIVQFAEDVSLFVALNAPRVPIKTGCALVSGLKGLRVRSENNPVGSLGGPFLGAGDGPVKAKLVGIYTKHLVESMYPAAGKDQRGGGHGHDGEFALFLS
jgi:hypothetical protein